MTCTWLPWMEWNWSTIWEAFAATGTLAAVVVALVGTVHARAAQRDAEIELAEERRKQADVAASAQAAARRAQAERVLAWWDRHVSPADSNKLENFDFWEAERLFVMNASHAPIFDVVVSVQQPGGVAQECLARQVLEPTSEPLEFDPEGLFDPQEGQVSVFMSFRDLAGRTWKRYQSGELVETTSSDRP